MDEPNKNVSASSSTNKITLNDGENDAGITSTSSNSGGQHTEIVPSIAMADAGADSSASGDSNNKTLRMQVGSQVSNITDLINNNLIVVRYATVSTVILLGVYGVANTPLFYRYKSVMDIPAKMFIKRKWIHGRIVGVVENDNMHQSASVKYSSKSPSGWSAPSPPSNISNQPKNGLASLLSSSIQRTTGADGIVSSNANNDGNNTTEPNIHPEQRPIVVLLRHSSPMERLLTQSAMDKVLSFTGQSSSQLMYSSSNPYRKFLPIELAGVVAPPSGPSSSFLSASLTDTFTNQFQILNQLIQEKTKISLQLLAHRTATEQSKTSEKQLPIDEEMRNTAICHLHYRQPKQWFTTTNASLEMVKKGEALINSCGMVVPPSNTEDNTSDVELNAVITDFNPTVDQLQNDAKFMSRLEKAEYSSWKSKIGMWSSHQMRGLRTEYAEEEKYIKSRWSTSVWSWVKRGWERIRSNR